jgi:hypothetical protein
MWMVDPKLMCNRHLLGEHGELHKFIPSFNKKYKIAGRIYPKVQVQLSSYFERHEELAQEMLLRGMNHNSPISVPDFSYLPAEHYLAKVDVQISIQDLVGRCSECRKRLEK